MEYITPIYDRTAADVITAGNNVGLIDPKGTINFKDLNRIENNTRVVANTMRAKGIVDFEIMLNSKYNWQEIDIPTKTDLNRIINNVLILQQYSVTGLQLEKLGLNSQWSWRLANAIEKNLDIMYKQEPRPEGVFHLKVVNGLGTGDYTDNTVVNVEASIPPADKIFKYWTGDAEDLAQLGNANAAQTTFTINHQDAEITATYKSSIPHKLKIINGTGVNITNPHADFNNCMEGDVIRVTAGPCPLDHIYWGWLVNDFTAENDTYLTTYEIEEAFTYQTAQITTFVMPAADVEIEAKYIYPGEHELKVINGLGSGEYNFGDLVGIQSCEDEFSDADWNYEFEYWSGPGISLLADDYEYVDIDGNPVTATKAPNVTLRMGDYDTKITANYSRYLKEPSQINVEIYIINSDDLKRAETKIDVDKISDIPGIKLLYSKKQTKFTSFAYSAPIDIITDETGMRWQFSHWSYLSEIIYDKDSGKITKIKTSSYSDNPNSSVSVGNHDTARIIVRSKVYDVNLEYCNATSLYNNITSSNGIISIPAGTLFSVYPATSKLDDGYNSDNHVITNYGYNVSDDGIINTVYNYNRNFYYLDENKIAENDVLKITYWRRFRDKYWYKATIFPDGNIDSEGIFIDTFKEGTSISLNAAASPEGKRFSAWVMGSVNKYTTSWTGIAKDHVYSPNMTTIPEDMLLLPNLCTEEDPGILFYKPLYSDIIPPTYSDLTIRTYSDDDTTYVQETKTLQNGRSYDIIAKNPVSSDYIFAYWEESTKNILGNTYAQKTSVNIQKDEIISSHYKAKNVQLVEIIDGEVLNKTPIETNKWKLFIGETVYIKAIEPKENLVFVGWVSIETGGRATGLSQVSSQYTRLYVGNQPIRIRAVYKKPEELTSYQLTLVNGASSGKYKETSRVAIRANYPDDGWEFYKWDGADEVFQVPDDKYKANPTIIMPPYPITLTAIYKVAGSTPVYTLIVNYGTITEDNTGQVYNGTNEEDFEEGTVVTVKANELDAVAAQNSKFYKWIGNTECISDVNSETTTITIPNYDVTINATYVGLEDYVLTVINGTGTGAYKENARANIIANLINNETHQYEFKYWSGDTQYIDDINIKDTYITMPNKNISVTAEYTTKYFLEVTNGNNSGFYTEGTKINITANENFVRWIGDIDYVSNIYAPNITITMPNVPIHISAVLQEPNNPNSYGAVDNIENITQETLNQVSGESNIGNIIVENETGNIGVQTDENLTVQYVRKSISPKELPSSKDISSINTGDLYIIKGE